MLRLNNSHYINQLKKYRMELNNRKESSKVSLQMKKVQKSLSLAYYSMFVASFIAALAGYYILQNSFIDPLTQPGISISAILIVFIIGSVPFALASFNIFLKKLRVSEDINYKLEKYRKAGVIRIIVIGAGVVLGILFFYIMKSQSMIFCAGIASIALVFCKPSEVKIITDLEIVDENI